MQDDFIQANILFNSLKDPKGNLSTTRLFDHIIKQTEIAPEKAQEIISKLDINHNGELRYGYLFISLEP